MGVFKKLFGTEMADDEMTEDDYLVDDGDATEDELVLEDDELAGDDEEGQLALDVFQDKNSVIIQSTIAGVKPEDLDITVASDMVTIKGERKREQEVNEDDYFYRECYWGSFSRTLPLPVEVDVDKVDADIKDGVLTLILPKVSASKTKKVKVKSES